MWNRVGFSILRSCQSLSLGLRRHAGLAATPVPADPTDKGSLQAGEDEVDLSLGHSGERISCRTGLAMEGLGIWARSGQDLGKSSAQLRPRVPQH